MTIKAKKSKINLREKLAELLNFRQIRDRLDGLGLYLGKDRTGTAENLAVRGGASIDDLQLAEISTALGGTAVDVFVYDTRNDSDGGKWRERTSHTSWYNEELNTATRGGRREFPAVAVIVAESDKVTIYDGDDPDLNMWMVFNASGGRMIWATQLSCVSSLNARLSIGSPASGFRYIDFVSDKMREWRTSGVNSISGDISERNSGNLTLIDIPGQDVIVNQIINDVAMTVLPNAQIDADTGLPVPTIAVATDGGVSVIKDDGTVVDITCSDTSFKYSYYVVFDQLNRLFFSLDGLNNSRRIWGLNDIPAGDLVVTTDINEKQNGDIFIADDNGFGTATKDMFLFNQSNPHAMGFTSDNSIGTNKNLFKSFINQEDSGKSLYNYITSAYNTGWMCGDIKLATLSDTKIETVGVDETTELIVDGSDNWVGNFDVVADVDAWIDQSTGTQSVDSSNVSGGVLTLTRLTADGEQISKLLNVEAGKKYKLTFDITATTNNKGQVWIGTALPSENQTLGDGTQTANSILNTGNALNVGSYEYIFTAESTAYLTIRCGGDDTLSCDNISVKQTGELITNGTFENGTTGWVARSGSSISVSGGQLTAVCSGNYDGVQVDSSYLPSLESGKRYVMSVDIDSISNGEVAFGVVSGSTFSGTTSPGIYSVTFTASNTTEVWIDNRGSSVSTFVLNSVSIRLAEEDRSVNDNGLQVFGEIDKTPVATGADLVAYNGFSENNYLMQPYNSDLDFGTGDFTIMFWLKFKKNSAYVRFIEKTGDWAIETGMNNSIAFKFWGVSSWGSTVSSDGDSVYGVWRCLCIKRESGVLNLFLDGVEKTDPDNPYLSNHDFNNESDLIVGAGSLGGSAENSLMSLLRISKTTPTPEQIAKIYRDEKSLFTDGAQATLYGTSDAVTALAYDDKTELLHVGTSGGRSDFAGLRRINNTTIPVTTSISASNNLIAEQ